MKIASPIQSRAYKFESDESENIFINRRAELLTTERTPCKKNTNVKDAKQ